MKCPPMTPELKKMLWDLLEHAPFEKKLGMHPITVEEDHIKVGLKAGFDYHNGSAGVHGGTFLALADTAAGIAAITDGCNYVTQSCNFNFIRPVMEGMMYADGFVIRRGRTVVITRAVLTDEHGNLLGEGTFNMFKISDSLA